MKENKLKKIYRNINLNEWELAKIKKLQENLHSNSDEIEQLKRQLNLISRNTNELVYANIFHDTIKHSKWLDVPLSLNIWAIGYNFAYILYRVLDDIKPKSILELGLGQSTKITNSYAKYHENINHDIVEHNQKWVEFFKKNNDMSFMSNFHLLDNYKRKYKNTELNAYKGFKKEFTGKKYDLIIIDAPIGAGQEYSRMDILDIIPECLNKSFIILLDDCERCGEKNTIKLLEEKLSKNNIEFCTSYSFVGRTDAYLCVSKDLEFLCTI